MEGTVAGGQRRPGRTGQLAEGVVQRVSGKVRVQLREGIAQALGQHHLLVAVPLGARRIGRNIRPVRHLPAETRQPGEGGLFYIGFSDGGHGVRPAPGYDKLIPMG